MEHLTWGIQFLQDLIHYIKELQYLILIRFINNLKYLLIIQIHKHYNLLLCIDLAKKNKVIFGLILPLPNYCKDI